MAVLQKLRNRAGLLIGAIGVALLAFLLTDFFKSNNRGSVDTVVAIINGKEIDYNDYNLLAKNIEENRQANSRDRALDLAWEQIKSTTIFNQEFEDIGLGIYLEKYGMLGITEDEMLDMVVGENIAPELQQIFVNPETRQYDKESAQQFLTMKDQDPQRAAAWDELERSVMHNRLIAKYTQLVTKGMHVTKFEAEKSAENKKVKVDFDYISIPYTSISDSIEISETEISSYYKKNKEDYKQDESRGIEYVAFDIIPSAEDSASSKKWLEDLIEDFKESTNDAVFVRSNSDEAFNPAFSAKGELSPRLDSFAFASEQGTLYPEVYFENGFYKLTKLSKIDFFPDSVNVEHILLNTQETVNMADSLLDTINNGATFGLIALQHSTDNESKAKGGRLGWITDKGRFPKNFYDTCFTAELNKAYIVPEFQGQQFVGVHIVRVTDKSSLTKKVQLSTISSEVRASKTTIDNTLAKAAKFAAKATSKATFISTAKEQNLSIVPVTSIGKNDRRVMGLQEARQLVKWAFQAELGAISDIEEIDNKFVVSYVSDVSSDGYKSLESVKNEIENKLITDKKAEKIIAQINAKSNKSDLHLLAKEMNTVVKNASNVTFASYSVPGLGGRNNKLIGVATSMEKGATSAPIQEDFSVYVITVTQKEEVEVDIAAEKEMLANYTKSSFSYYRLLKTLEDNSEIEDNRFNFQ